MFQKQSETTWLQLGLDNRNANNKIQCTRSTNSTANRLQVSFNCSSNKYTWISTHRMSRYLSIYWASCYLFNVRTLSVHESTTERSRQSVCTVKISVYPRMMWASASWFRQFTDTNVYWSGSVKTWKTRHKISVDIRIFFSVLYSSHSTTPTPTPTSSRGSSPTRPTRAISWSYSRGKLNDTPPFSRRSSRGCRRGCRCRCRGMRAFASHDMSRTVCV